MLLEVEGITCAYDGTDSRLLPLSKMDDYSRPDASIARIPREDHSLSPLQEFIPCFIKADIAN